MVLGLAGCARGFVPGQEAALPLAAKAPTALSALGTTGTTGPTTPAPTPTPKPKPKPKPKPLPRVDLRVTSMTPKAGTYGVAIMVSVEFNRDVPARFHSFVQKRLTVTTSKPMGSAGWAWMSDRTVMFRPAAFWPGKTKVTVKADLAGMIVASKVAKLTIVGKGHRAVTFSTGRSMITAVSGKTQMAVVRVSGKVVRRVPVSMGKPGWETSSGVKAIMERELDHVYTNTAVGDFTSPYRLVAHYNLRLTWSGEFLHSAPWAEGRLGQWAGSHGCTNASDNDAGWFYHNALYGDPLVYTNTGGGVVPVDNTLGGPWNIPWKKWMKRSAGPIVITYHKV
jgi:lipoprotein-anchoring transpeptidase ErfK/SrfK